MDVNSNNKGTAAALFQIIVVVLLLANAILTWRQGNALAEISRSSQSTNFPTTMDVRVVNGADSPVAVQGDVAISQKSESVPGGGFITIPIQVEIKNGISPVKVSVAQY
jgi:hypothetical protein